MKVEIKGDELYRLKGIVVHSVHNCKYVAGKAHGRALKISDAVGDQVDVQVRNQISEQAANES